MLNQKPSTTDWRILWAIVGVAIAALALAMLMLILPALAQPDTPSPAAYLQVAVTLTTAGLGTFSTYLAYRALNFDIQRHRPYLELSAVATNQTLLQLQFKLATSTPADRIYIEGVATRREDDGTHPAWNIRGPMANIDPINKSVTANVKLLRPLHPTYPVVIYANMHYRDPTHERDYTQRLFFRVRLQGATPALEHIPTEGFPDYLDNLNRFVTLNVKGFNGSFRRQLYSDLVYSKTYEDRDYSQ